MRKEPQSGMAASGSFFAESTIESSKRAEVTPVLGHSKSKNLLALWINQGIGRYPPPDEVVCPSFLESRGGRKKNRNCGQLCVTPPSGRKDP